MSPVIRRRRQQIVVLLMALSVQAGQVSANPIDTVYQCIPSGFTVGIPVIQVFTDFSDPFDGAQGYEYIRLPPVNRMQNQLAQTLSNSGLFRDVLVFLDDPHPDSADLSLLVSIARLKQLTSDEYPEYEMVMNFILVENLDSEVIWDKKYAIRYTSVLARVPPLESDKFNDSYVGFLEILGPLVGDLGQALNQESGLTSSWEQQRQARTVSHLRLESLWLGPVLISGTRPGLANYAEFIEEKLQQRLARKNCFTFHSLDGAVESCLEKAVEGNLGRLREVLPKCSELLPNEGMLLVLNISDEGDDLRVQPILIQLPDFEILYNQSLFAPTGWRLNSTLENLASGIAQASHNVRE